VLRHEQRLSGELAHELRTPLTGLRGEVELALARDDLDAESRGAFERMLASSSRMQNVIETLLETARTQAAASSTSSDPLPAVREALAAVAGAARSREVETRLAEPPSGLVVDAAPALVTQALYPLLENGVRHARGNVEVAVARANGHVTLSVRDDGPGLEGRDPDSVFSPGVSSSGGAGLGLPLARRLARSCGGDVVAVGGDGGIFELRLPGGEAA
jgi:signal transduction histidine kinase